MDGLGVSGQWINKNTGKIINVRDSIIDGDNMIILTDSGQIDMNEFSKNYVQASDEIYDENGHVTSVEKINPEEIASSFRNVSNAKRNAIDNRNVSNVKRNDIDNDTTRIENRRPVLTNEQINKVNNDTEGIKLVKKLLEKTITKINIELVCDDFPIKELQMLQTIYDVTPEDISKCIFKYFITDKQFNESIKRFMEKTCGVRVNQNNVEP